MATKPADWDPPEVLNDEWVEYVDSIYPSPSDQANEILTQISDPWDNPWKIIFFAIEALGNIARPMFNPDSEIARLINTIGRDFYGLHYFNAPSLYDLQRVSTEEVDSNGVLPINQTDLPRNGVSEAGPDVTNGGS